MPHVPPWIAPLGWYHLVLFGLAIPYFAYRSHAVVRARPLPSRRRHMISSAVTVAMMAAFSILTARLEGIPLFPRQWPRPAGVVAGLVMLPLAIALMRPRWRRAVERRTRIVHLFMPRTREERALWALLAVVAGIGEEITWRAVQPALVAALTGSPLAAVLITAGSFGVAHMLQGWRSSAIIVLFALGFQTIVALSGCLYVAMAVHALYDVTAGWSYGRLGRDLGYPLEPLSPDVAAPAEA